MYVLSIIRKIHEMEKNDAVFGDIKIMHAIYIKAKSFADLSEKPEPLYLTFICMYYTNMAQDSCKGVNYKCKL